MVTLSMPAVFPVTCHTDKVGKGTVFVVIKGLQQDGMQFVPLALERGASRIIVQADAFVSEEIRDLCDHYDASLEYVVNARKALAQLSAHAAGYPATSLKLYGVTGTKGKTSSVWMMYHLLAGSGVSCALLSTVGNYIGNHKFETVMTTPQPDYIHQFLRLCSDNGVTHVVMEVAAQASTFFRLETLEFEGLIFTNLEQEHGDLYPTLDVYFEAKKIIIREHLKSGGLLFIHGDSEYGMKAVEEFREAQVLSFKDFHASWYGFYTHDSDTTELSLVYNKMRYTFHYDQFIGLFNAYNLGVVIALLLSAGIPYTALQNSLARVPAVPGRMEKYVLANGATVIIDYAHTAHSFEALFSALVTSGKKLYIVFGAGGGKDPAKRPLMGKIAAQYGTRVFVTNDNPRFEDPEVIITHILQGIPEGSLSKVFVEEDRKKSIEVAIAESDSQTLILLLGKGPDEYQIVNNQKIPFSERLIVSQYQ